jgi:hypothetical protein
VMPSRASRSCPSGTVRPGLFHGVNRECLGRLGVPDRALPRSWGRPPNVRGAGEAYREGDRPGWERPGRDPRVGACPRTPGRRRRRPTSS